MLSVIIRFPAPVVHFHVAPRPAVELRRTQMVVEHNGSLYLLTALLERLPDYVLPDYVLDDVDALVWL